MVVTLLVVILLAASFYLGTRVGQQQFALANAQYEAAIAAGNLKLLETDTATLRMVFQVQLSTSLANHGRYLESNLKWLWPTLNSSDNGPARSAVKYRLEHPYSEQEPAFNERVNVEFKEDVRQGFAENQKYLQSVINVYK